MNLESVKEANCEMCLGKSNTVKQVFTVSSPAFSGDLCAKHLAIILSKNGEHTPPALLKAGA